MAGILSLLGCLGIIVATILLLIYVFKKKSKKLPIIIMCISLIVFFAGATLASNQNILTEDTDSKDKHTAGKSDELKLKLNVKEEIGSDNKLKVIIDSNLPKGTEFIVSLNNEEYDYSASDKVALKKSKGESEYFSDKGNPLKEGTYILNVVLPISSVQPDSVRDVVGKDYKNVKSNLFEEKDQDKTIKITKEVKIKEISLDDKENLFEKDKKEIKKIMRKHIKEEYDGTKIDEISVVNNAGNEQEGHYIAHAHLIWETHNNGKMSKEMLEMYSDDLAAYMYTKSICRNVDEVVVYWKVPYLDASAKCHYERRTGGMYRDDDIWVGKFE